MSQARGLDLLVEWCSVRGSGSRAQFDAACQGHLNGGTPARSLARLERMGYVDVDWEGSGRWGAVPTSVALVEGSGGNAALLGARTAGTWARLAELEAFGVVKSLRRVETEDGYPATWFIGVSSGEGLDEIASALGARAVTEPVRAALHHFVGLHAVLSASTAQFLPSGFQAKRFDAGRLRFVETEVSRDHWPPGCFEQRSQGRNRYLFVDDDGTRHVVDRWVAIHAELDRCRKAGAVVPHVLTWDKTSERMANLAGAQLPVQWARAAILCTGAAPRRKTDGAWTDIYEGVKVTLWKGFCEALAIPMVTADLSRFD